MTAQEFGEWQAWYDREQQQASAVQLQHAQLLAAIMNGPLTRPSGGLFRAAEFMVPDPWAPPAQAAPVRVQSAAEIAAQVAMINARMG